MEGFTISSQALTIFTGLISIGTPMAMLAYNAGKMRQQMMSLRDDVKELRDMVFEHINVHK